MPLLLSRNLHLKIPFPCVFFKKNWGIRNLKVVTIWEMIVFQRLVDSFPPSCSSDWDSLFTELITVCKKKGRKKICGYFTIGRMAVHPYFCSLKMENCPYRAVLLKNLLLKRYLWQKLAR